MNNAKDEISESKPTEKQLVTSQSINENEHPTKVVVFKGDKDNPTKAEFALIITTIILIVINIFIVIYASNQASAAINAVKIAKDALDFQRKSDSLNTISQNKKDSLFALYQNRIDSLRQAAFILENRAYLVIDNVSIKQFKVGEIILVQITIKNVGKTPAYKITEFTGANYGSMNKKIFYEGINRVHSKDLFILGAGQEMIHTATSEFSTGILYNNDFNQISNGTIGWYLYGEILYRDKFDENHFTRYCLKYDTKSKVFVIYDDYYDAD